MIAIDHLRCSYCGGCVSVCPENALTLAETRLTVNANCTECENCVFACPVGALHLPSRANAPRPAMRRQYDVIVVGAGPGGALAAEVAARAGLATLLIEKRQEIGSPVRCAEGVGAAQLAEFIAPDPRWIAAEISQLEITTRDRARAPLRASGGRGYVLERRVFDRALAERAAQAGAEVRVKTAVTGVLREAGRVRGVKIRGAAGDEIAIAAPIVIAADGVEAQVGNWAGLDTRLPLSDTMTCAQYVLAGVEIDPTCTAYTLSQEFAPGGYIWIFPKGQHTANVGLGVQADLPRAADPIQLLTRFIESQPQLARGAPVTQIVGNVPVALSPARIVTDGLMLIGDAARQVDPLTGGGIINAMIAGHLAAQVASEAIRADNPSANFLQRYAVRWQQARGQKLERNYRLRAKFPAAQRSDERFIQAFALAAK